MRLRCHNPVLVLYLLWTYALPAFVNWVSGYQSEIYANPGSSVLGWMYAGLLFLVVLAFAFKLEFRRSRPPRPAYPIREWQLPQRSILFILLAILVVATIGAASGLSRWRYAEDGLSSSLDVASVLYVLAPSVLEVLLFVLLFFRYEAQPVQHRWLLIVLAACMALTASGIGPMLAVLLAILAFIAPGTIRGLLFRARRFPARNRRLRINRSKILLLSMAGGVLGVIGYLIGDAIKTGTNVSTVVESLGEDGTEIFINYLIGRLSVHWYSLVVAVNHFVDLDTGGQFNNLLAPISNAWFRFSALTGGWWPAERPLDGSLSRVNYNLINLYPVNDREGTSPGLIASFIIAFPVWLAPFALAGYLSLYHAIQKRLRRRMAGRPTWLGEALMLYFTAIFFASPVDFLLIFDPMLLMVLAWLYFGFGRQALRRRTQEDDRETWGRLAPDQGRAV